MAEPVKFMFDLNLDPDGMSDAEPEAIELSEHERLLDAARRSARAEGLAAGRAEAEAAADSRFSTGAAGIEDGIRRAIAALDEAIDANAAAAADLALAAARCLAPSLVARLPLGEVETLLADCAAQLRRVPHLVVRVNETLVEPAQRRLDPVAAKAGYEGRLVIMGEPDIAIGDCRIEWADGSVVRDIAGLDRVVRDKVTQYLAARMAARKDKRNG